MMQTGSSSAKAYHKRREVFLLDAYFIMEV